MTLTDIERDSQAWRKVSAHLDELIAKAQRNLEKMSLSNDETMVLRGEIKAFRKLKSLDKPSAPDGTEPDYR